MKANKKLHSYYIDNLRTLLIILVILWHMAVTYGAPGFWPYQESQPDDLTALVFTLFSAINGPYVLGFSSGSLATSLLADLIARDPGHF